MKMKLFFLIILTGALSVMTGCFSTEDGHLKAGVPFAKDRIESLYERTPAQIMEAARAVLKRNGAVDGDNTVANTLHGKVDTRHVWIKVEPADPKVSRVTVQVRTRAGGGDIDLASEIDKQIALQLAGGR